MILDDLLKLADAQESTVSVASTSYIDTLAKGQQYKNAIFYVRIDTACTSAGATTVDFALQTDDNTSFSSATTVVSTGATAKATLVSGKTFKLVVPVSGLERYIRGYATIATGPLLAGKWDMFVVLDADRDAQLA